MIGTILSITDDILFNPPAIVKKQVIRNTITASNGLIPNASFKEFTTDSICPRIISQAFVNIPRSAEIHIQKIAPGPPIVIAVATPPMFPTPIVLAIAVHAAANPDTVPFPLNIFPNVFWK